MQSKPLAKGDLVRVLHKEERVMCVVEKACLRGDWAGMGWELKVMNGDGK